MAGILQKCECRSLLAKTCLDILWEEGFSKLGCPSEVHSDNDECLPKHGRAFGLIVMCPPLCAKDFPDLLSLQMGEY